MSGDEIIGKMTLKDKIRLCSGANFWQTKAMPAYGIPALTLSDGPLSRRPAGIRSSWRRSGRPSDGKRRRNRSMWCSAPAPT